MATAGPNDVILVMTPAQAREVLEVLTQRASQIAREGAFLESPPGVTTNGWIIGTQAAEAKVQEERYARIRNVTERLARALDDGFVGV